MERGKYLIGEVSKISGASQKRIRSWERFLGHVDRIYCGKMSYRYYTEQQLELVKRIKGYLDKGFRLDFAAKKAKQTFSHTRT